MIDTHVHLDFKDFDEDREEVISRAFDSGVKKIINVGVDIATSRKSIALAEKHENIFASVGIHPQYFMEHGAHNMEQLLENLKDLAKYKKVVAIGEIGLDYYHIAHNMEHGTSDLEEIKNNQKKGFLAQIELAGELNLSVIVHCRNAFDDLFEIIKNFQFPISNFQSNPNDQISKNKKIPNTKYQILNTKFVLHCYSGERKDTEKFLKLPNVFFSFSGNITYPKPADRAEKLARAVRMIPLERMMLDSDSPFLAPQEFRGKRNEPSYVRNIAEKIAEIKGISFKEVEKVTDNNAILFFGLG